MPLNSFTALYLALSYWCWGSKIFFSVSSALKPMEKKKKMPFSSCHKNQGWKPPCTLSHLIPGPFKFSAAPLLPAERELQPRGVCVHVGPFLQKTVYSCVVYCLSAAHHVVKCSDYLMSKNRCKAICQQRTCSSTHFSQVSPRQDSVSTPQCPWDIPQGQGVLSVFV